MVRIEDIPREVGEERIEPYRIGYATIAQEDAIREYAYKQGFMTLRGFWRWMMSEELTYYDILREESP